MKDVHDPVVRREMLRRLQALRPDSEPGWGGMTPAVMLFHLNAAMKMALGELVAEPVGDPVVWHSKGKAIALGEDPWPKGAPTSREALPEVPVDMEVEREQFARFTYTHAQHHFRQFGI